MIKRRRYGNKQQQSTIPKREKEKPKQSRQLDNMLVSIFVPTPVFLFFRVRRIVPQVTFRRLLPARFARRVFQCTRRFYHSSVLVQVACLLPKERNHESRDLSYGGLFEDLLPDKKQYFESTSFALARLGSMLSTTTARAPVDHRLQKVLLQRKKLSSSGVR